MTIQCSIGALKEGIFNETLAADEKQDLSLANKAVTICWSLKDKETTLKECNNIILILEN